MLYTALYTFLNFSFILQMNLINLCKLNHTQTVTKALNSPHTVTKF